LEVEEQVVLSEAEGVFEFVAKRIKSGKKEFTGLAAGRRRARSRMHASSVGEADRAVVRLVWQKIFGEKYGGLFEGVGIAPG